MTFSSSFLAVLLCVVYSVVVGAQSCARVDDCSCSINGKQINLESLGYPDSRAPRFPYELGPPSAGWEYAYNPCYPFSDGSGRCNNAVVCQRYLGTTTEIFNVGDATANWMSDTEGIYIEYSHSDEGGTKRTSHVYLSCDPTADVPRLERRGQDGFQALYLFTLTTKCACPGTCETSPPPPPPPASGISHGSILCILFSLLVVAYFVGGALFLRFGRHAQGKEIIPNYEMWVGVPGNIKDGVLFVTSCGKKTGYEEQQ
ncbi:uncharacterized protein LOC117293505 [Asterias rubens]|uniref:uncharacterized protein LOC117293505 n=1 Tax=Asterias rubens TaxID=7604 RepID=UPI0014559506|nr:uncharacterized protein LOC117293505 [Asterias rubens]